MRKKCGYSALSVVLFLATCGNVSADADIDSMTREDLYKMIVELKKEVGELTREVKELKREPQISVNDGQVTKQDIETIVDGLLASNAANSSIADRVHIHASVSQGYLATDDNNWYGDTSDGGMFDFNEFTINFSANLTDRLRTGLQLMSRDLGDFTNNDIDLDWANLDYAWRDILGIRAGILKVPFGLYSETRDIDAARIAVLLPQGFYCENLREVTNSLKGGSIYGSLDLQTAGILGYTAMYGSNEMDSDGEIAAVFTNLSVFDVGGVTDLRLKNVFAGALNWFSPIGGLLFNLSYQYGEVAASGSTSAAGSTTYMGVPVTYDASGSSAELRDDSFSNYSVGMEYTLGNLVLAAEYRKAALHFSYDVDNVTVTVPGVGSITRALSTGYNVDPEGWYVSASYRFTSWLAGELSYSEEWYKDNDRYGNNTYIRDGEGNRFRLGNYAYQNTWSVNARFDINDYWIIKAGVNFNKGFGTGYWSQNSTDPSTHWNLYQLKTTISF